MGASGYKGISRVDNPKRNTYGWSVRVTKDGKTLCRFLSDSVHGGEQQALRKAVRARNALEREVGRPRTDRVIMPPRAKKTAGNSTGVVGVNRISVGAQGSFEVTWAPEPGKLARTKISIAKYGEEEALRRAMRLRRRKERALFGTVIHQ
ncbi:MAG TPA: hypothetical protein VF681_08935 [Abditibacteriaceae bacterium]|jgi:hypothetical protein